MEMVVNAQFEQPSTLAPDSAQARCSDGTCLDEVQAQQAGAVLGDGVQGRVSQAVAVAQVKALKLSAFLRDQGDRCVT